MSRRRGERGGGKGGERGEERAKKPAQTRKHLVNYEALSFYFLVLSKHCLLTPVYLSLPSPQDPFQGQPRPPLSAELL